MRKRIFNYRLLYFGDDECDYFEVRRVYYEDEKPIGHGSSEVSLYGESVKEVKRLVKQIAEAFKKPVLYGGIKFPEIYRENGRNSI